MPVDFTATPEIYERLLSELGLRAAPGNQSDYFDSSWEALLRYFNVDCRVLSYDQFVNFPTDHMFEGSKVEWWKTMSRSTPNRMWRQVTPDGVWHSVWGHRYRVSEHSLGAYEEVVDPPLHDAQSVEDLKKHPWPEPDWWDFSPMPGIIEEWDQHSEYHIRFRIGSVFELAWQLRGMENFLYDLVLNPEIPMYIMERLTEIYIENTRKVISLMGDRLDMVYIYDDIAGQENLLISKKMWSDFIRPHHEKIINAVDQDSIKVMYHTDGAASTLIPELIELGVDVLNPIQADAPGMDPEHLKSAFGDRLSFHGGIDIIKTLPTGTPEDVKREVLDRKEVLGKNGGYIMSSSHHIQADTPTENILAMYDKSLR
jgi:uroporphyrinogen decarboxylase